MKVSLCSSFVYLFIFDRIKRHNPTCRREIRIGIPKLLNLERYRPSSTYPYIIQRVHEVSLQYKNFITKANDLINLWNFL